MTFRAIAAAAALLLGAGAQATASDPRVRYLPYDPGQVVNLMVDGGFAAVVELGREESVENVVVGNSAVWQVTVNSSGNRVIVKPLPGAVPTDMILITAERRYVFLLQPSDGSGQGHFLLTFTYPDTGFATAGRSQPALGYKFAGEKALFPKAMRDDGRRTTITWDEKAALPAVFAMAAGGEEAIVNGRMVGRDYVIEGIARRYVFRLGKDRAVATRTRKGGSQ
ncbi:MAG TPA: TrbG/VirB9 family P-type conjugative transfer protein [Allosphingosinicella sp.]|nr:TrbG/VirB9 family P-type conjugative transfer protein [Allosphingosinicella sp.]